MDTISFKRHRFPPDIIRHAIWLYARFTLSYRDVEDLLAERGLDISYESVRRWFLKFGAPIARNLRHTRPIPNGYWHLDEMVIVIRGQRYWLWRAVMQERMEQMLEIDGEQAYEKMRLAVEKANQRLAAAQFPSLDRPERRGPKRGGPERDYGPSR